MPGPVIKILRKMLREKDPSKYAESNTSILRVSKKNSTRLSSSVYNYGTLITDTV